MKKIITISREFGVGGGEGSFATRVPEIQLSQLTTAGTDPEKGRHIQGRCGEYASLGRESSGQFRICPEPV